MSEIENESCSSIFGFDNTKFDTYLFQMIELNQQAGLILTSRNQVSKTV